MSLVLNAIFGEEDNYGIVNFNKTAVLRRLKISVNVLLLGHVNNSAFTAARTRIVSVERFCSTKTVNSLKKKDVLGD